MTLATSGGYNPRVLPNLQGDGWSGLVTYTVLSAKSEPILCQTSSCLEDYYELLHILANTHVINGQARPEPSVLQKNNEKNLAHTRSLAWYTAT